ncbi:hypothetical protein TNCV_1016801 [Trichonephila clavipes]|uniref:Uncharacterized protein n=1 Tax=Trichonephila clavipes TaxID=2585209 RepID=A0A8X7BBE0_TRICX|nr:hypothetical protein TNCV_1016801 [Trichonephila clavipes]
MWSSIILLKIKSGYSKRNGSKTILRMSSTYRCSVSVSLMTPKVVWFCKLKEMAPQTITPGRWLVWHAIVKAGSARCPKRLQTRLW